MSRYHESRIAKLPVAVRIERIKARLDRRVYHRLMGDYAGGGHDLFNVNLFADDCGMSVRQLYDLGFVADREDYGWNLPFAPTEATLARLQDYLAKAVQP